MKSSHLPEQGFEVIDHTADQAIMAYGKDLAQAFENAAYGMFSLTAELGTVSQERSWQIEVEAESAEDLLMAWLRELLFTAETENVVLARFKIHSLEKWRIKGEAGGGPMTPQVKRAGAPVKAVTYHDLSVKHNDLWKLRITFDV